MNLMLDDKEFYDTYGVAKEDSAELLIWRVEKLLKELREVLEWQRSVSSNSPTTTVNKRG